MAWDGYIGVGTWANPTFTESVATGYARVPFSFRDPISYLVQGAGATQFFTTTDAPSGQAVNAFGFFTASSGGTPIYVWPFKRPLPFDSKTAVRVGPSTIGVNLSSRRTSDGIYSDMDPNVIAGLPAASSVTGATLLGTTTFGDPSQTATQDVMTITPGSGANGRINFTHSGAQNTAVTYYMFDSAVQIGSDTQNFIQLQPGGNANNFANINCGGTSSIRIQPPNTGATTQVILGNLSNNYVNISIGATAGTNISSIVPAAAGSISFGCGPSGRYSGVTDGSNAVAGYIGEYSLVNIVSGSAVALTNNTAADIGSLSLTAGDWDVACNVWFSGAPTGLTAQWAWMSQTSATAPAAGTISFVQIANTTLQPSIGVPFYRVSVSATTTVYFSTRVSFTGGTCSAYGQMQARRRR